MSSAELLKTLISFLSAEIEKSGKITDEMSDALREDFLNTPRTQNTDIDKLTATIAALQSADRLTQRYESLVLICRLICDLAQSGHQSDEQRTKSVFLSELYGQIEKNVGLEEILAAAADRFEISLKPESKTPIEEDVTFF